MIDYAQTIGLLVGDIVDIFVSILIKVVCVKDLALYSLNLWHGIIAAMSAVKVSIHMRFGDPFGLPQSRRSVTMTMTSSDYIVHDTLHC